MPPFSRRRHGRPIAPVSIVAAFSLLARLVGIVFVAYRVSSGGRITVRAMIAFALGAAGAMASIDGFVLAVKEEARSRDGRVTSGVVIERLSSTGRDRTRRIGRRVGRDQRKTGAIVTANGFAFYDPVARMITAGSPHAWVIDYRFGCTGGRTCLGRDFVSEDYWSHLRAGAPVNVRQARWETTTSRLDDNPRWATAVSELAIGVLLLTGAALVSGRLVLFRRRRWVAAPAVVLGVEKVIYGEDVRWRIRFGYVDSQGLAQESADEVASAAWKSGDSCVAVYDAGRPDLATLQPVSGVRQ